VLTFRYHLVTLVAVFLALAVGVVVGSTFVGPAVVESLRNQVEDVSRTLDDRKAANDRLRSQNAELQETIDEAAPYAVDGRLDGTSVVVVSDRGIDEDVLGATDTLLQQSGATAPGTLWLDPSWALTDEADRALLANTLGVANTDAETMQQQAWRRVLADLAAGAPEAGATGALLDAGFLDFQQIGDGASELSDLADAQLQVLLVSGPDSDVGDPAHIGRMAAVLADRGDAAVVAESFQAHEGGPERGTTVAAVRDDAQLAASISTVDDLEVRTGRLAAVLAQADAQRAVIGHYGYGPGAQRPLPEWAGAS
jgi:Copper transport outer membrane protein, MctB